MKNDDIRAASFLGTEGVNLGGLYSFSLSSQISELQYLGITNARAGWATPGVSGSDSVAQVASLAATAGVTFDFVDEQLSSSGALQPNAQLANYDALEAAAPGSIASVEGLNEINNQPISYGGSGATGQGQDELNAAIAYQQTIYREVTADPALAGVGVDYFTGYSAGSIPSGPDPAETAGLATADTQHPYPNFGEAPAQWVDPAVAFGNLTAADIANGATMVYTETGYSSVATPGGSGVDEATQARYTLDLLLDDAQNGVATTYLYDINDGGPVGSSADDGFGLFYALDNTADPGGAKPVATAIHNMNAILADSGATATTFTPDPVAYAVSGLTATGNDMEMQKSNGASIIALWDEQPIWNNQTNTEIAPTPHDETIALGNGSLRYDVAVYDPLIGTAAVQTASDVGAVTVAMSSDPLFIEVTPVATPAVTSAAAVTTTLAVAAATTATTASDTVVLNLGELQHNGVDATFSVSIGGAVVGTGTVTAAEAAGASDSFTYTGNFGTGPLDVVVSMLDGFTGNAADMGRTLYVNSISVNGQANFENTIDEYDNPETYALTASPAATPPAEATPDTLTLNLSDTALAGQGALFEVAVNGTLVSQPTLVTAASGASQNFTFTGDFGSNATVTVDFINGYTGGAYGEELVVNSITLDGATTKENADLYYNGATSYTVAAGSTTTPTTPVTPVTPTTPTAPVTPTPPVTTPTTPTTPAAPSGATIPMTQYAAPATSGVLATPLETANWNPQTQLAGFLSAAAAGNASILFMGDSTTAGVGSNPANSADTAGGSPEETAYWLNQDGVAAQAASVLGVNNNGASEQLTFAGGGTINGAASVDGPTPLLQGKGASETFTPDDPILANQIEAQVYGGGTNTIEVTVNGTVAGTITASNDGRFDNDTLQLPQAETVTSVTFTNEGTGGQYIEGVETNNTASKAIKVLNAGVSGGTALATNYQEQYGDFPPEAASTVPNVLALDPSLVVLDYGINDMNFGESVPTFISAISGIVSDLQAAHIDVVLMSPTPFNDNGGGAGQEAQLVSALGSLAVADNIPFIDLNDTYGGAGAVSALTSAGFFSTSPGAPHPSAEAYANIGQGLAGLLTKAIDASTGTSSTGTSTTGTSSTGTSTTGTGATGTGTTTPNAPTTPVTTPAAPTSPTLPTSAVNALAPTDPASVSGIGANALVTYNWTPSTQLANFIADPTGSSIAFVGDSTTLGFGATANDEDYVGTAAMPAEVTSYLNNDGIAAQDDNFEGQGNELGTTPDPRVALVGGAQWSFPMLAGGELVATSKAGDGVTFTPLTPTAYTAATITYFSLGGGTLDLSVNGGSTFDAISLGNSNSVVSQTVALPTGTPISSITATQAGGTADDIEGIGLSGASTQAAQVYDLGVGGAESSIVGAGSDATGAYTVTPISASTVLDPTVVFINYGINDMLQGNLTAAQTTANIGLAVKEYQAAGSEPVIVIPQAIGSANYAPEIASLQSDIDSLAQQYNVPVIDLSATYGTSWQALAGAGLMSDYAHPDGTLYSDMGKGIAGLLAAAVHQG